MTLDELVTLYTLMCEDDYKLPAPATRRELQFMERAMPGYPFRKGKFFAYLFVRFDYMGYLDLNTQELDAAEFTIEWEQYQRSLIK